MKLTAFTDYSLRVLIYLAITPGRKPTIAEITQAFDVSENHLTKVVHALSRGGWIATSRGRGGGMTLGHDPADIRIGAVVRETEGAVTPAECFESGGGRCAIGTCCHLKGVLGDAIGAFYAVLDRVTLADVVGNAHDLSKVLHFHPLVPAPRAA